MRVLRDKKWRLIGGERQSTNGQIVRYFVRHVLTGSSYSFVSLFLVLLDTKRVVRVGVFIIFFRVGWFLFCFFFFFFFFSRTFGSVECWICSLLSLRDRAEAIIVVVGIVVVRIVVEIVSVVVFQFGSSPSKSSCGIVKIVGIRVDILKHVSRRVLIFSLSSISSPHPRQPSLVLPRTLSITTLSRQQYSF